MAIANRFQPPEAGKAAAASFVELSSVVDQLALLATYKPEIGDVVQVSAGEFRRLAPRAAGQGVTIPTADASNFQKTITLFVEAALGACRIRPVAGTIDGATAVTLRAGYVSLIVMTSNGQGKWATSRAFGFPTAGNSLSYSGDTLNYTGSTSRLIIPSATGNLGTVDISTLECGGSVFVGGPVPIGDWQIEGFTSKPAGFWFNLAQGDAAFTGTLLNEDATPSAALRLRCPGFVDASVLNGMQAFIFRNGDAASGLNRWSCVVPTVGGGGGLSQSTAQTQTASTTNLTTGTYTIPANMLQVGSAYEINAEYHAGRGATLGATNLIIEFLVAGAVVRTLTIAIQNTATQNRYGKVTARLSVRTTGAGGTAMMTLESLNDLAGAAAGVLVQSVDPAPAAAAAGTTAIDTTVTRTLELRMRLSAATGTVYVHMFHCNTVKVR